MLEKHKNISEMRRNCSVSIIFILLLHVRMSDGDGVIMSKHLASRRGTSNLFPMW
jgi:hypothetical protein